jgi:hypothetical protein
MRAIVFRRRWLFALVVAVLWGLATHGTHAGEGDEPHYLAIAHSIAFDFDLDVSNNYGRGEPLVGGGALDAAHHTRRGRDGTLRPVHDVGLPLLFAPFPRLGVPLVSWLTAHLSEDTMRRLRVTPGTLYKHFVSAVMIPIAALLAVQLFGALRAQGSSPGAAFAWSLLIALSPPLLVISISFFTEVTSALVCLVIFRRLVEDRAPRPMPSFACGAGIGLLVLLHARNAGLAAGLLALAALPIARRPMPQHVAWLAAGFGALAAVRTSINLLFWGTWITSPHARPGEWTGATAMVTETGRRAAGLLLDQEYGLLPYSPLFALVPVGLFALARTNRPLLRALAVVCGAYLLLVLLPLTNAHGWTGGWSPAGRFWVPIVPLLALAVVAAARLTPRPILMALVALQIGIGAYLWQHPKSNWNDGDGTAAVCSRSGATFCRFLPSFVNAQERQRPAP